MAKFGTFKRWATSIFCLGLVCGARAQDVADQVMPEFSSGRQSAISVTSPRSMVVAANRYASEAGDQILQQGGNAIDAMVTVQLVLGLVEPQSSGLGGGAFLVYWDAASRSLTTFDGRETAPSAVNGELFLNPDGSPMKFFDAVVGGRSVGVPGTPRLLHGVHKRFGQLAWREVVAPAIELTEAGFVVSPRLNASISRSAESLARYTPTRAYFLSEEGVPLFTGTRIFNSDYAATLRALADGGADAFYSGPIADAIVATVQDVPFNPGALSHADLARYQIKERAPVCAFYRRYEICGMGPPSSGALTVGQILQLIEPYPIADMGPADPHSWRLIGDASRLAFADRGLYMADSDFVAMPKGLLNRPYLQDRSKLLSGTGALAGDRVKPGNPPTDHSMIRGVDASLELPSTSHFSIVDQAGNIVSMTTTIENGFGSRLMTNGFLLNNELTDFSFRPTRGGKPVANRVEPGKRPRSSMSPTIVFENGKPILAVGSPGGSRIIGFVAKTLIAYLDWKMDLQSAIELPHLVNRFGTFDLEKETSAEGFAGPLEAMGYKVAVRGLNSGLHGIAITPTGLSSGVDPRREGLAIGR